MINMQLVHDRPNNEQSETALNNPNCKVVEPLRKKNTHQERCERKPLMEAKPSKFVKDRRNLG
jgi:hypothetical protein